MADTDFQPSPQAHVDFYPEQWKLGSALTPNELAIGYEDSLQPNSTISFYPDEAHEANGKIEFELFSSTRSTDALQPIRFQFMWRDVCDKGIVLTSTRILGYGGRNVFELNFHLRRPPRFWVKVNNVPRRGTERDVLLDGGYEGDKIKRGLLKPTKGLNSQGEATALMIGRWLTYRFTMPYSALEQFRNCMENMPSLRALVAPGALTLPSKSISAHAAQNMLLHRHDPKAQNLPFGVLYAIEGLVSFGIIIDAQIPELLDIIQTDIDDPAHQERVLHTLFRRDRIWDLRKEIERPLKAILKRPFRPAAEHMALVAKALITPTRILLYPPEQQSSNAVLRRFPKQAAEGRFLRIQFWDEHNRLNMIYEKRSDTRDENEGILARYRRAMEWGITIAGRHYVALDFSASQVRTGSFWAICEDKSCGFTRINVRTFLGDFSQEKNIARNGARRGQLYSTTRDLGRVAKVYEIPDYETKSKPNYCYSDGVGLCSQELVTRAAIMFGHKPAVAARTCVVQFRMGGTKGILVAWPPRPIDQEGNPMFAHLKWPRALNPMEIARRPSQVKYGSAHANIGACKVSAYAPGYLNREVLTLLWPRGISHDYITDMFDTQVNQTLGAEDTIADGRSAPGNVMRLLSTSQLPILDILHAQFGKEPFVKQIIRVFSIKALNDLKWKAKIFVEKGFNGLGVVDELGVLNEGEIYCRTITPEGKEHTVVGKCIISRAPQRHPGDVQTVNAVDHAALRASGLTNVIIFNRQSEKAYEEGDEPRDLASKLGGGDLDGDDYTILWDEGLTRIRPVEPMDYHPPPRPNVDSAVTSTEIRKWHNEYMKKDTLGAIANAHLAWADSFGPDHPNCMELSYLHSVAVDFAKTGIPAEFPEDLRPTCYPDFMGPRLQHNVYKSTTPLGIMFRDPRLNPVPSLMAVSDNWLDPRLEALPPTSPEITNFVRRLKSGYDMEMQGLCIRFEATEAEIVAGIVLPLPVGIKRMEKDKIFDPLQASFTALRKEYRAAAIKFAEKLPHTTITPMQLIALATYRVTHMAAKALSDAGRRKISFPWLFHEELISLVTEPEMDSDGSNDEVDELLIDFSEQPTVEESNEDVVMNLHVDNEIEDKIYV